MGKRVKSDCYFGCLDYFCNTPAQASCLGPIRSKEKVSTVYVRACVRTYVRVCLLVSPWMFGSRAKKTRGIQDRDRDHGCGWTRTGVSGIKPNIWQSRKSAPEPGLPIFGFTDVSDTGLDQTQRSARKVRGGGFSRLETPFPSISSLYTLISNSHLSHYTHTSIDVKSIHPPIHQSISVQ
jgi:hypothetical protein